jgi:hypothetical protein
VEKTSLLLAGCFLQPSNRKRKRNDQEKYRKMKKQVINLLSIVLMTLVLFSCDGNGKKGGKSLFTPVSSGRPYEMLVVIDKAMWERPAGRALFNVLDTDVPGLPQPERSFRISNVGPENFNRGFRIFRNIIDVDIQPIYTQPKLKYSRDSYSSPQMIMTIQAPDEASFEEFVTKNRQVILDFFTKAEMNRQINLLKKEHSEVVSTKVGSMFGCDVWVPADMERYKQGEDFLWASNDRNTSDVSLSFVIYSYPYTDKNTFTKDFFVHKRDSVMKMNIPGSKEGQYMATDAKYVDVKNITVRGEYALEARGLWYMENDMMGGPFVSHARVDRPNGRVVVVEAFVYAPEKKKRDLMRQLEASLYTLNLPQEQQIDEIVVSPNLEEVSESDAVK